MTHPIRPYQASDFEAVYALWQTVFASTWPIASDYLQNLISGSPHYRVGDNMLVEQEGRVIGFITTQTDGQMAEIPFVMVSPHMQRQGIATQLHNAAVDHLRERGVETISLGRGSDYYWRGVPNDIPEAQKFFEFCGWRYDETDYDLTQNLHTYRTPSGVLERAAQQGIEIRIASPDDIPALLQFEQRVFPDWADIFRSNAEAGRYTDTLIGWDGTTVVASLLMEKGVNVWHKILGDDMGGIGVVGVDDQRRGRGIGLALTARASEILQERGVGNCFVGWTNEIEFYSKLGYTIWHSYAVADPRPIASWS